MKKIECGHKVDFLVPKGREYNCSPISGVVYKITFSDVFKAYTIFVKPYNSFNLSCIMTAFPNYGDFTVYKGKVSNAELKVIQGQMVPFGGPPKITKTSVKRGSIKICENPVVDPNTDYMKKGDFEIFVKTKKTWFPLHYTTAKMAFFNGGRCSINNVSEIRKMK